MLYLEILLSLTLWISTYTPFLLYSFSVRSNNILSKINEEFEISNEQFQNAINNSHYNNQNWCQIYAGGETDGEVGLASTASPSQINLKEISGFSASNTPSYILTDGANLYVAFNSASTTDPDFVKFKIKFGLTNLEETLRLDTGPGLSYLALNNRDIWAVNTSINSHFQKFKIDDEATYINYKINSAFAGAIYTVALYVNSINVYYPYVFLGMRKNSWNEFLAFKIDTLDFDSGQDSSTQHQVLHQVTPISVSKFDSSVQKMVITILRGVFRLFVITPSEPEIKLYNFSAWVLSSVGNFDINGTLGNIRTIMWDDLDQMFIGRSQGNQELYKIDFEQISKAIKDSESALCASGTPITQPIIQVGFDFNSGVYSMAKIVGKTANQENNKLLIVEGKTNPKIHIVNINNPTQSLWTENIEGEVTNIECLGNKGYFVKKDSEDNRVYLVEMVFN